MIGTVVCYRCVDRLAMRGSRLCKECYDASPHEPSQQVESDGQSVAAPRDSQKPKVPRLNALSRSAAFERFDSAPAEWRIEPFLTSVDYGALVGPKGVGKTVMLEDAAVSMALGEPWFGRFEAAQSPVLVLTCEESEGRTWRRLDAIAASKGHAPSDLEGCLYVHPIPFNAVKDVASLAAEVEAIRPGLTILDPAYKYLVGANTRALFDMGAVLTPLQVACQKLGSALIVGHHTNRREGASREERISGAGILEWARVLITVEQRKKGADQEGELVRVEITGNSISPLGFTVLRQMVALDESANPELSYHAEVTTEGAEEPRKSWTAEVRIQAILPANPIDSLTVAEVQNGTVDDASGLKPLTMETTRKTLQRLRELGQADSETTGRVGRWWKT